jgi:hypothetical protein
MSNDTTDTDEPTGSGEKLGASLASLVSFLLLGLKSPFVGFWKRMKGGASLGESLIVAGYKLRLRNGGDAIVNVIYEDGVVKPRAANYNSDGSYFETDNGERFSARGIGYNPRRVAGKVPVVWAMRIGSEVTEPLEAAIARSRRQGHFDELERPDGKDDIAMDVDPTNVHNHAGSNGAVADGGVQQMDGTVLSFREGYELFGSKVTKEDMDRQEKRGKLAALDFKESDTWKWILAILGAAALGMFGPEIAMQLGGAAASGAGGAGGFPI